MTYSALVVEVTETCVNFIRKILDEANCRTGLMYDGYKELGRALTEPFDLFISALEMPHLNGFSFIAALKIARGNNSPPYT